MFLKKLGKRGVAMTEYAILLAFVAAVAGSFTSDNGLASSIKDAVGKAENAINLAMGKPAYRYNTPLVESDKQYQALMDSVINGIYDSFSTPERPLCGLWIKSDGTITGYSLYANSEGGRVDSYRTSGNQAEVGFSNQFCTDGFSFGGGDTHLMFSPDGKIVSSNIGSGQNGGCNDINSVSRVYVKDSDGNKIKLYYNRVEQNFSSESGYWNKGITEDTP